MARQEDAFKRENGNLTRELTGDAASSATSDPVVGPAPADLPVPAMSLEESLKNEKPEGRVALAAHCMRRNAIGASESNPQTLRRYRVDNEIPVMAWNELDAIARTNDLSVERTGKPCLKGPDGRKVVLMGS